MTHWIGAGFLVGGFLSLIRIFGLVQKSRDVVGMSRHSFEIIRDPSLSDDQKGIALREDATRLFRLFFVLAAGGATAVLLPAGLVWLCDCLGLVSFESVLRVTVSPVFLILSSAFAVVVLWFGRASSPLRGSYSTVEKTLHRVAFNTYAAQASLADLEDRVFARQLAQCKPDRPVFVTALPRAGTTLLLESLGKLPEFASHCYRDMPFVLVPCFWSRFSTRFRQSGGSRERAHGDGMTIDFDSPESFEEVLWKTFWRRHYLSDRIMPWREDEDNEEFSLFFRNHMCKIVLLRRQQEAPDARYLSKNNLNVARAQMLRRLFPDSVMVVPFRHPLEHAASLLEQHRNFLHIHENDSFSAEYMRAIGHFDFGNNLRPVDFDGWFDRREPRDTLSLAFWLEYWVATYRNLLSESGDLLRFVSYEALCEDPESGFRRLADAAAVRNVDALVSAAEGVRPPRARQVDTSGVPSSLVNEADDVYAGLRGSDKTETGS